MKNYIKLHKPMKNNIKLHKPMKNYTKPIQNYTETNKTTIKRLDTIQNDKKLLKTFQLKYIRPFKIQFQISYMREAGHSPACYQDLHILSDSTMFSPKYCRKYDDAIS